MLASFFHSTILNHRDLRSALSFQLANKLDSTTMPAIALREVIELALRSEPELLAAVAADICAVQDRDPAVDLFSTPLLYLKGFHALQGYGWPTGCGVRDAVRWRSICKTRSPWCSAWMYTRPPASARASCLTMPPVSWSETAVIENDVSILQSVTLGGPARRVAIVTPKSGKG
jgi:serine O-acetyltransferase